MQKTPTPAPIVQPNVKCRKCEAELKASQTFCLHCGTKVNSEPTPISSRQIEPDWVMSSHSESLSRGFGWMEILPIGAGVVVVMVLVLSLGNSPYLAQLDRARDWVGVQVGEMKAPRLEKPQPSQPARQRGSLLERLPAVIPVEPPRPSGGEEPTYMVLKRDGGTVSVLVPSVSSTTPVSTLQSLEQVIGAREHASSVRIYGNHATYVGTFVGGVFQRDSR